MLRLAGGALVKWLGGGTIAAVLALGGGWLWHDWQTGRLEVRLAEARGENVELQASLREWQSAAEQRKNELERVRLQAEAARASVDRLEARLADQEADYDELRAQIRNAPPEDDGPVALVLRDALEGLP